MMPVIVVVCPPARVGPLHLNVEVELLGMPAFFDRRESPVVVELAFGDHPRHAAPFDLHATRLGGTQFFDGNVRISPPIEIVRVPQAGGIAVMKGSTNLPLRA
jgi:hypothetical protein